MEKNNKPIYFYDEEMEGLDYVPTEEDLRDITPEELFEEIFREKISDVVESIAGAYDICIQAGMEKNILYFLPIFESELTKRTMGYDTTE